MKIQGWDKLKKSLNGIDAAIVAFSIMTGGKLSKQLYSEDLITSKFKSCKKSTWRNYISFLPYS
jgi:hypothetical protein